MSTVSMIAMIMAIISITLNLSFLIYKFVNFLRDRRYKSFF